MDPKAVASAVLYMRDNPEIREQYARNAEQYSASFYSRTINTQKHIDLLSRIAYTK